VIRKRVNSGMPFKGLKNTHLIKLALLFLVFIVCLSFQNTIYGMTSTKESIVSRTVLIQEEDNDKEITITRGDIIQIELKETGASGYKWHLSKLDPAYLELISEETKKISEKELGAPVKAYWKIMALKKGNTEILIHYYRSWEGQDKALRHYRVKIHVI
jgi:predicted secreted protein